MFKTSVKKIRQALGFTMTEVLVVVGILAIVTAIAIPSILSARKNTRLTKVNDYARAIYIAAQDNLNQMRASGQLNLLVSAAEDLEEDHKAIPNQSHQYSYSKEENPTYDLIVPGSLDASIRNNQVIIEYNPRAGIVYSVFYYEGDLDLLSLYNNTANDGESSDTNALMRSTDEEDLKKRKEWGIGYYSVENPDGLEEAEFKVIQIASEISYENGQEGILFVKVPIKDNQMNTIFSDTQHFIDGLELNLTLTGENGGEFSQTFTKENASFTYDNGEYIVMEIPLDTLRNNESFTEIPQNRNAQGSNLIAAGDNVTVTADVIFYPTAAQNPGEEDDPIIMIESSTLAGINPMFHSLTLDPDAQANDSSPYILAISNGRHLQNLAELTTAFAGKLESIVFTHPNGSQVQPGEAPVLDWSETARHYRSGFTLLSLKPIDFSGIGRVGSNPPARKLLIDGNGVTIQNLTVVESGNTNFAGLFGKLQYTTVKDVHLLNPTVAADDANATGALAGSAENSFISDCSVENQNSDTFISGKAIVGGLVGSATNKTEMPG